MSRRMTVEEGVLTCIAEISKRDARIAALEAQLAKAKVTEPVAWQRRIKYPTQPGAVSPWVTCSADEATGHFERSTLHEYRCLYTFPSPPELEAENARLKACLAEAMYALMECEDYFDNRADADHDGIGFVANEEMKLQVMIRRVCETCNGTDTEATPPAPKVTDHRKIDGAIRGLNRIKSDFKMRGSNATTIERAIQALRAAALTAAQEAGKP